MDELLVLLFLAFLLFVGVAGMRMGKHMTVLFKELKEHDPELWRNLAQPNTANMFDVAGYMRGNQILFKGNNQLATHPVLSERYHLARKWFLRFQVGGIIFFVLITIIVVSQNAL